MRRGSRVFICFDEGPLEIPNPECPNAAAHEPFPSGYLAAHACADKLMETHMQKPRCRGCGLWHIWTPKEGT